jgi:2,3-bisphosphoglycerate-dependent phosphoglycerate mutase
LPAELVPFLTPGIAGSRDSPLTAHGVLQAKLLASHLSARSDSLEPITHVFASDLSRAYKTAEAVVDTCSLAAGPIEFVGVRDLREKSFGALEGAKYSTPLHTVEGDRPETIESMKARLNRFLDQHLFPVVRSRPLHDERTVIIVAHGVVLNVLLKALASRIHPENLMASSVHDFQMPNRHFSWRNTGYLESVLEEADFKAQVGPGRELYDLKLNIEAINCVDHLNGLKKTGGGIGSSKFDPKQATLDAFLSK